MHQSARAWLLAGCRSRPPAHPFTHVTPRTLTGRVPLGTPLLHPHPARPPPPHPPLWPGALQRFGTSARTLIRPHYSRSSPRAPPTPPHPGARFHRAFERLPPGYILFGLVGLNVLVFLGWGYARQLVVQFRDPSGARFMSAHFISSWANLASGRLWTLVTPAFSHVDLGHMLFNLLGLYFVCAPTIGAIGNGRFAALYLFSGVVGNMVSLAARGAWGDAAGGSTGASGAIMGTLGFVAALSPRSTFLIFGIVPCPAWLCVGGMFCYDLYKTVGRSGGTVDSAGHLGGLLAGLFFFRRMGYRSIS